MLKKSKLAVVAAAAVALIATSMPASHAAKQLEIFTWWASGGEAAGLKGMTDIFTQENPGVPFVNASVAGAAGVNEIGRAHV